VGPLLKKMKHFYYPPVPDEIDLRNRLPRRNLNKITALNVGVGNGSSGLARQLPFLNFKRLDNIDVFEPYLDTAATRFWEAEVVNFIKADVRDFDFSSYDWVLMFDVLEHLPKGDALRVLDEIQCSQLIFIPLEKEFRKNTFEAKSQDHLSFWTEWDFKEREYKTEVLKNFHREGDNVFDALWAVKNEKICLNFQSLFRSAEVRPLRAAALPA
jgi:trans-aconitate methyltransferase